MRPLTRLLALSVAIWALGPVGVLSAATGQPGDVNNDHVVDLLDALDLARYLAGTVTTLPRLDLADVNGDGTVNADDRDLLLRSVIYCVSLDDQPPVVTIVSPEDGATVRSTPVTVTSRVVDASPIRSVTCTFGTTTINAATSGGDLYGCNVPLGEGENSITITAVDVAGNAGHASVKVVLSADVLPPQVKVTVPLEVLPGSHQVATADVTDNDRVESVVFVVNGVVQSPVTAPPYQQTVDVPEVASPGDTIPVRVVATDPSGNEGSDEREMTVVGARDSEPPKVSLSVPTSAAPGERIKIAATATDNVGVAEVTFLSDGTEFFKDRAEPYEAFFVIPPGTPVGATIAFSARAVDAAGNAGDDAGDVHVVGDFDTTPPVVHLVAPAEVMAGHTLDLTASATDNVGVQQVTFYVDGAAVGSDSIPPYQTSFRIADETPPNKVLALEARAEDFSGNAGSDQAQTVVLARSLGVIAGEVYSLENGRPLEGALVTLESLDGSVPSTAIAVETDSRGRYRIPSLDGKARLSIAMPGFTPAWREVQVVGGRRCDPLDALLTLLDTNETAILSVSGGDVVSHDGKATLSIPGGALETDRTIRVTPVGGQGLPRSLPVGWSPIAAAEISMADGQTGAASPLQVSPSGGQKELISLPKGWSPANVAEVSAALAATTDEEDFRVAATLTLGLPGAALPEGSVLVAVRHDVTAGAWVVENAAPALSATRDAVTLSIGRTGEYAIVVADKAPYAPPPALAGQALGGAVAASLPSQATALITPSPKIIFADPAARSNVQVHVSSTPQLQSGTVLRADLDEHYNLLEENKLFLEPRNVDLTLYMTQGASTTASTDSAVTLSPSRAYAPFEFHDGEIDISAFLAGDQGAPKGATVGSAGAQVTGATGESIDIPAQATSETLPVVLSAISQADFPVAIPDMLSYIGGLRLDLHGGDLSAPAMASLPLVGASDAARTYLVQLVESNGASHLAVVAASSVASGIVTSNTDPLGDASVIFPGPRSEGRYAFLESQADLGFITGTLADSTGKPLSNGLVTVDTFPFVAITDSIGNFTLVAPVGTFHLTVLDSVAKDVADLQGAISAAKALARVNGNLTATPPRITEVSPPDGKQKVPLSDIVTITFSEPVAVDSVAGSVSLSVAGGQPVVGSVSLSPDRLSLTFRPDGLLLSDTVYQLHVSTAIRDLSGNSLPAPFQISFHTEDITPPPRPPAGNITATIPDSNGFSIVSGSPGTVDPSSAVAIRNLTTGALTTLNVGPDGSFTGVVSASRTDKLELLIVDASGNQTTMQVPRFRNTDGSVVVGTEGGDVPGTGGAILTVPPDALPEGTVVRVDGVPESELALPMPSQFPYVGALRISLGGVSPLKPLEISIPAAPDAKATDQVLVGFVVHRPTRTAWTINERAHLVDGRYMTASPPFPGITGEGTYGFLRYEGACVSYVEIPYNFTNEEVIIDVYGLPFIFPAVGAGTIVTPAVCDHEINIEVRSSLTDEVIREIAQQSPTTFDSIELFAGRLLSDDANPPSISNVEAPLGGSIRESELRVTFSEPVIGVCPEQQEQLRQKVGVCLGGASDGFPCQPGNAPDTCLPGGGICTPTYVCLGGERAGLPCNSEPCPGLDTTCALNVPVKCAAGHPDDTTGFSTTRDGRELTGSIEVFRDVLRFVPDVPFSLGSTYNAVLKGITDMGGNPLTLNGEAPTTAGTAVPFNTGAAESLQPIVDVLDKTPGNRSVFDLSVLCRQEENTGYDNCTLFIANGVKDSRAEYADPFNAPELIAMDVNRPSAPRSIGRTSTSTNPRALEPVRDVTPVAGDTSVVAPAPRDVLAVSGGGFFQYGEDAGKLNLYDISECMTRPRAENTNCLVQPLYNGNSLAGQKYLSTARGEAPVFNDVPPDAGIPDRVVVIDGTASSGQRVQFSYVNVLQLGVEGVDVRSAFNWARFNFGDAHFHAGPDLLNRLSGVKDVASLRGVLFASQGAFGPGHVQALTPGLEPRDDISLAIPGTHLASVENLVVDVDRDGRVGDAEDADGDAIHAIDEVFDVLLVAGPQYSEEVCKDYQLASPCGELDVVDVSGITNVHTAQGGATSCTVARIPLPSVPSGVAVDPVKQVAVVSILGTGVGIIDLSHLRFAVDASHQCRAENTYRHLVDQNQDGRDDRILALLGDGRVRPGRPAIDLNTGTVFYSSLDEGILVVGLPYREHLRITRAVDTFGTPTGTAVVQEGDPTTGTRQVSLDCTKAVVAGVAPKGGPVRLTLTKQLLHPSGLPPEKRVRTISGPDDIAVDELGRWTSEYCLTDGQYTLTASTPAGELDSKAFIVDVKPDRAGARPILCELESQPSAGCVPMTLSGCLEDRFIDRWFGYCVNDVSHDCTPRSASPECKVVGQDGVTFADCISLTSVSDVTERQRRARVRWAKVWQAAIDRYSDPRIGSALSDDIIKTVDTCAGRGGVSLTCDDSNKCAGSRGTSDSASGANCTIQFGGGLIAAPECGLDGLEQLLFHEGVHAFAQIDSGQAEAWPKACEKAVYGNCDGSPGGNDCPDVALCQCIAGTGDVNFFKDRDCYFSNNIEVPHFSTFYCKSGLSKDDVGADTECP
jgi:Big-like domain-containing protein/dockerin type I repeat protein/carboxypeptidase family protein/glucodextranase-like protein